MISRSRILAVAAALVSITAACSSDEVASSAVGDAIEAPATSTAGRPIEVVVVASGGDVMTLNVTDAYVTTSLTVDVLDGRATFELPSELTTLIGRLDLTVPSAAATLTTSTDIVPAAAVDPVDIVVGPRTIVADGADQTMAVAFVTDRFGNPLVDGTGTTFTRRGERGDETDFDVELDGGLAATLISASVEAERVDVVARVSGEIGRETGLVSRRADYLQVPGRAAAVTIEMSDTDIGRFVADGRTVVDVTTGVIVDVFGNELPDGHVVRLEMDRTDGFGQLTSTTIDGRARFVLEAPRTPGAVSLRARVDDAASDELVLSASPAVSEIPLLVSKRSNRTIIELGPVLDHDGAIVADGTVASVRLETGVERNVQLAAGRAIAEFEGEALDGNVTVTVLGVSITAEIPA